MHLADKLKAFEKQLIFMKWGSNESYGRINYVGYDFLEFEIFNTRKMEYTDKLLINIQLVLEIVIKGSDIARILAEYSVSLPAYNKETI